mgnify:CR=1 FL=1
MVGEIHSGRPDQHILTQEEKEEEAVLSANLKRNLVNKSLVCLLKLSFDVTDGCCNGRAVSVPAMGQEVCSLEYVTD